MKLNQGRGISFPESSWGERWYDGDDDWFSFSLGIAWCGFLDPFSSSLRDKKALLKVLCSQLEVKFKDTYDFDNTRGGKHGRYRRRLANLLLQNKFSEFNKEYFGEAQPVESWRKVRLDLASTFASFMYALERRGWTKPLPWEVSIPMKVAFRDRAKSR